MRDSKLNRELSSILFGRLPLEQSNCHAQISSIHNTGHRYFFWRASQESEERGRWSWERGHEGENGIGGQKDEEKREVEAEEERRKEEEEEEGEGRRLLLPLLLKHLTSNFFFFFSRWRLPNASSAWWKKLTNCPFFVIARSLSSFSIARTNFFNMPAPIWIVCSWSTRNTTNLMNRGPTWIS